MNSIEAHEWAEALPPSIVERPHLLLDEMRDAELRAMTAMPGASADVGKVAGRLRGQVSRTGQNIGVTPGEGEGGGGLSGNVKTTAPMVRAPQHVASGDSRFGEIDKQPRRKGGGQPGNRNAFKTGLYAKEPRALCKQIAQWKRETGALLRLAKEMSRMGGPDGHISGLKRRSGG